jgi:spore maturation protein CgeB
MNILLIGPFYANATHGAECGVYDALVELGHYVSVWDYRCKSYLTSEGLRLSTQTSNKTLLEITDNDLHDLVICLGPGLPDEVIQSKIWKRLKDTFRVLWNSEPLRLPQYKEKMIKQKKHFNMFCTFDESEIPIYKQLGINAYWVPQAYNPKWYESLILPAGQRFDNSFVFIGSVGGKWENRVHFLNQVKSLGFKVNATTIFDAIKVNKAYNMHVAVLNLGLYVPSAGKPPELKAFGLQQRIFEAIGAGKLCITNKIPVGTNELFTHNENILFYDQHNLKEILQLALDRKERKRIEANVEKIKLQHTYKARMQDYMDVLNWNL